MGIGCSKNKRKIHPLNDRDVDKVEKLRRLKTIYSYNDCIECSTNFNSNFNFVKVKKK